MIQIQFKQEQIDIQRVLKPDLTIPTNSKHTSKHPCTALHPILQLQQNTKKKKKTITKLKNHYFATTKFLGFRWHKKRPTKNSKQQSKFKGQRRKLQRKVRKRGHSRISSGVENWRRPVGLLLNFPLPIVPFQSQPTLRYDFSNSILLLLRSDYLFMRLLKFERTTKRRCTLHPLSLYSKFQKP